MEQSIIVSVIILIAVISAVLFGTSGQCSGCFIAGIVLISLDAAAIVVLLILYCIYRAYYHTDYENV